MPGTALGSVGSAGTKTDTVTVLMELQVSQEDMRLTNDYQRLMHTCEIGCRGEIPDECDGKGGEVP